MSCCNKSIVQTIAHGAMGLTKALLQINRAPEAVIMERRNICRRCDHSTKHPTRKAEDGFPLIAFCKRCGCNLKAKTSNAEEACCEKKWSELAKVLQKNIVNSKKEE